MDAALLRIPDGSIHSEAEEAAWRIWDRGVPFLVDPLQRRVARNKLYTHRLWEQHGIRQPRWSMGRGDFKGEVICKPLCGCKSEGVQWAESADMVTPQEPYLMQEYRKPLALWRVIVSPTKTILSYKKVSAERIIAVSTGARREFVDAPDELSRLGQAMAASLGGGIWGCDIIEDEEGFWALEANLNFGFPLERSPEIAGEILFELSAGRSRSKAKLPEH